MSDVQTYTECLETVFSQLVLKFNALTIAKPTVETMTTGVELVQDGHKLLSVLKTHMRYLETTLASCEEFNEDLQADICLDETVETSDQFIYGTKAGLLFYPGKETFLPSKKQYMAQMIDREQPKTDAPKKPTKEEVPFDKVPKVLIPEINFPMKIPNVKALKDIPPAFYMHESKIYIRINNDNLLQVPFPEVIDSKKEFDRKHSIRCKYIQRAECDSQRVRMARTFNSPLRTCNFAHEGDYMVKIGYPSRCPGMPSYGNTATMAQDIKSVRLDDVKNLILYGLNDLFSAMVWLEYHNCTQKTFAVHKA